MPSHPAPAFLPDVYWTGKGSPTGRHLIRSEPQVDRLPSSSHHLAECTEMRLYGVPVHAEVICSDVRRGLCSATMTRVGLPSGTRTLVGGSL